jgi:hypothetical protein
MNLNIKALTKLDLMKEVQDVDIYKHYIGQDIGKDSRILSPLREEKRPSFGFFIGESGEICYKDFVLGTGDCIQFVQELFGLNFYDAMSRIVIDFNLTDKFHYRNLGKGTEKKIEISNRMETIKRLKEGRTINITRRKAQLHDVDFWYKFGITKKTLSAYNVHPIEYFFVNGNAIKADKYAYAFIETKDNKETYKIYQPYNKDFKWLNDHDESVWQGWSQLPEKGTTLIITKSLKDVMAITDVLNIPSVALQSESVKPKDKIIKELKDRFEIIHILYDNDYDKETNWGEKYSEALSKEFNLLFSQIPEEYKSKDFSDLVFNIGEEKAKKLWEYSLCIPF